MPFRTYYNWLFDGSKDTPIPKPRYDADGKEIVPDILKYNSPISHTFAIGMFLKHGPLNHYLNKYFNDINLRYLDKEDLFMFLKQAVIDFRVTRKDTKYIGFKHKDKLFKKLREKFPQYKNNDLTLLCELIEKSDDREKIYQALDLEIPKKKRVKKQKKMKEKKITLKEFLEENFSVIET